MNILYISQYFKPEMGAPAARVSELSKYWVKFGNNVTVITGMPNHPNGIIHPTYKWEYFKEEKKHGIRVLRVFLYVTPNKGVFKRIISFFSFMITSLIVGLLMQRTGVVIATSPQLFVGLSGYVIAKMKKKPFVFEVRDIWPQSAIELGVLKNKYIIKMMEKLEKFLYEKSDLIIVAVESMKGIIANKGIDEKKIKFIPNGIDKNRFSNIKKTNYIKSKIKNKDAFIIGYIGTMGLAHKLEILLESAKHFQDKNVYFVLIGDGADKEHLENIKKRENIKNVLILDKVLPEEVPGIMQEIDMGFVHLRDIPLMKDAVPSKIYEFMAAGKPILAGVSGIAKDFIEKQNIGVVFQPENTDSLIKTIENILKNKEQLNKMGENGKRIAFEKFSRENLAKKYIKYIKEII